MSTLTIDEQMKEWEQNANDPFGRLLRKIEKATNKYFSSTEDEYGIIISPLSHYITTYDLDGPSSRKRIASNIEEILKDYDIIPNDHMINSLMFKLKNV